MVDRSSFNVETLKTVGKGAVVGCAVGAAIPSVTVAGVVIIPITCPIGAVVGGIVTGYGLPTTKIKPYLLVGNAEEIIKTCQQK